MFQVDDYKVEFRYTNWGDGTKSTECFITKGNDTKEGFAICDPSDNFCKNTGRKLALTRALKSLDVNYELRTRFWDAYFTARNGKH